MKTILLVRGIPGSGKTTLARMIVENHPNAAEISADDFFESDMGDYIFSAKDLPLAHLSCKNRTETCMKNEVELIVVHNTFTREREMTEYFDLAEQYNYRVSTVIAENRHDSQSVHGVPTETIEKMKNRFSIKL